MAFRKNSLSVAKFFTKVKNQLVYARQLQTSSSEVSWEEAKPYKSIPGPKPLPIPYYGNFWRFLSIGKLNMMELHHRWYKKYGPIVRLTGKGPDDVIFLYEPEYFEEVFRNEGVWPNRDIIKSMTYYREVLRKDYFEGTSLVTAQGEKWKKNRTILNQHMMNPRSTIEYAMPINEIADQFIERIKFLRNSQSEMPEDFMFEIGIYTLETTGIVALDTRFGAYKNLAETRNSTSAMLAEELNDLTRLMFKLDYTPSLWHFITTPTWKKFIEKNENTIRVCSAIVDSKLTTIKEKTKEENFKPISIFEKLYTQEENRKLAVVVATELLSAGLEAVSETVAHTMYNISKNPEKQENLFQELKSFLPRKDTPIDQKLLNELRYLKACFKESFRLTPVINGNQRRSAKDSVLGGYQIPKESSIMAVHCVPCTTDKYFENAQQFIPERWLKSSMNTEKIHAFASLPFGYGPRSCVGRRFADLQAEMAIAKIFRNFKVEFNHGDMTYDIGFLFKCSKPLRFKIEERPE